MKWERIAMVIVQNKIDIIDDAVVQPEEPRNLAKKLRLRFYRTFCLMQNDSKNHSKDKSSRHKHDATISLQPSKRRTHGKKSLMTAKCELL
nr:hypothetical protein BaRGS_010926 [Batillaria attramentaria]